MVRDQHEEDEPRRPTDPPEPGREGDERGRRTRVERMLRESVRRAIERGLEAGIDTLSRTDKAIRGVVAGELPKELVGYIFQQVDETKNSLVRVVAREVRDFLEATDLAAELQRALTSLSFEVRTEIRFVPNEAGGIRPSVRTKGVPRRKRASPEDDETGGVTPEPED